MKRSKNMDELCYPFIHEQSYMCDFEVITDELCALLGSAVSGTPDTMNDIQQDLEVLQPMAFHLNGSMRGRMALSEGDINWVSERLAYYRDEVEERLNNFVLPRGTVPVPQLHLARSACKKAIRALVRLEQEGVEIPDILPRFCNLLCNLCFTLTVVVNKRRGLVEPVFVSKSYGKFEPSDDASHQP
jgi:ATP:cob(I)alamin adenosyltransferase